MMKRKVFCLLSGFLVLVVSYYLGLPAPAYPSPPPGSLQSDQPADTESFYRRSYFTNLSREEVIAHYSRQFYFPGQIRLNYPPESSYAYIRDQTLSSWLEELVHPWRESLYINGFYPTKPTQQINIDNVHYLNKITVRLVPSHPATRLTVLAMGVICLAWLYHEYARI